MRILTHDRVLFTGQHLCPEFDCPRKLPDKLKISSLPCRWSGPASASSSQAQQPAPEVSAHGR